MKRFGVEEGSSYCVRDTTHPLKNERLCGGGCMWGGDSIQSLTRAPSESVSSLPIPQNSLRKGLLCIVYFVGWSRGIGKSKTGKEGTPI